MSTPSSLFAPPGAPAPGTTNSGVINGFNPLQDYFVNPITDAANFFQQRQERRSQEAEAASQDATRNQVDLLTQFSNIDRDRQLEILGAQQEGALDRDRLREQGLNERQIRELEARSRSGASAREQELRIKGLDLDFGREQIAAELAGIDRRVEGDLGVAQLNVDAQNYGADRSYDGVVYRSDIDREIAQINALERAQSNIRDNRGLLDRSYLDYGARTNQAIAGLVGSVLGRR